MPSEPSEIPQAKVTIGIPMLNPGRALVGAIRSVFAQTFEDWALVLVDDGSGDGSVERARAIRDPRVVVVADGQHRGLAHRLNQLAVLARGPYLARMDADDLMHPDRLARQVDLLDAAGDVDVAGSGIFIVDGTRSILARSVAEPLPGSVEAVLEKGRLFYHPTVIYRSAFARENPYDPGYPRAEDLALWCRIVGTARCAVLDDPLLFYRVPIPVDLRAYAGTTRSVRALLRTFGGALSPGTRRALLWKTHGSVWAYRSAGLLGLHRALIRRRGCPVPESERRGAEAALARIDGTRVPGWDLSPSPQGEGMGPSMPC